MGRSDKKVKQDRISGIRKKYEAYLEEDKKRKERNEYILGKLDKMRSCATLVPQKYKSNHLEDVNYSVYNHPAPIPEPAGYGPWNQLRNLSLDIPTRSSSESLLINQLLNKYILIPKRHANYDNKNAIRDSQENDTRPELNENINNPDWRSKYEILNELKRNEKEPVEERNVHTEKSSIVPNAIRDNPQIDNAIKYTSEERQSMTLDYKRDVAEKDVPKSQTLHTSYDETNIYADSIKTALDKTTKLHAVPNSDLNANANLVLAENKVLNQPLNDSESEILVTPSFDVLNGPDESIEQTNNEKPQIDNIPKELEYGYHESNGGLAQASPTKRVEHLRNNTLNPTFISEPKDPNTDPNKPLGDIPDYIADIEHPIDIITVNDFAPVENAVQEQKVNDNPESYEYGQSYFENTDVHDHTTEIETNENKQENYMAGTDSQTIVPEHVDEHGNPAGDTSGIEAFESEQNEMFYQEPVAGLTEQDPQGTENPYGNENYQQNDQYYYEGQEQTYPAEINEHEETQEPYDQTYAQQYSDSYGQEYQQPEQYEQQQVYEPQQQEYEQPPHQEYEQPQQYEQPQTFDQVQEVYEPVGYQHEYEQEGYGQEVYNEQENYEKVQQEVDNEEGISIAEFEGVTPLQTVEKITTVIDKPTE